MDTDFVDAGAAEYLAVQILERKSALNHPVVCDPGQFNKIVNEKCMRVSPSMDRNDFAGVDRQRIFRRTDRRGPQMPLAIHEFHECEPGIVRRPEGLLDATAKKFGGFFGGERVKNKCAVFPFVLPRVKKPFAAMRYGQLIARGSDNMSNCAPFENGLPGGIRISDSEGGL